MGDSLFTMQEKKRKKLSNTNKSDTTKHTNANKGYQHRNKIRQYSKLEIMITRAAPAFQLFMVMGCVFDINTVHKTVEKLTFQAFY